MLILPWATASAAAPDPQATCTVFAARLPLRGRRATVRAVVHALAIRSRLRRTPGLIGHSLALDLRVRTLWTVSAWADRTALLNFERSPAHRAAMRDLHDRMLPPTLVVWTSRLDAVPVSWTETCRRVAAAG